MDRTLKTVLISATAATLVAVAIVVTVVETDRPTFCKSCHEMGPYYNAWQHGPHKGMACVECHVDPGLAAHAIHKIPALKELAVHLTGDPKFPLAVRRPMPPHRCTRCHENLPKRTKSGFEHATHASKTCPDCHTDAGHTVTVEALQAAGVFAGGSQTAIAVQTVARAGSGTTLARHSKVSCSRCHKMTKIECGVCHNLPAKHFQPSTGAKMPACTLCHRTAGASWAAAHPTASSDCLSCHNSPTNSGHPKGPLCATCHKQVGVSFAFGHPTIDSESEHDLSRMRCAECHPTDYTSYSCTCHRNGVAARIEGIAAVGVSPMGLPSSGPNNGIHVESGGSD
jgi:hypothetical protein